VTAPVQEFPFGLVTAEAPTSEMYAELLLSAVSAVGAVKLITMGAEFACPAVSGPVLVTVKLVIAAAWAGTAPIKAKGRAAPIVRAEATESEKARDKSFIFDIP
jgi:hypothetical protein